MTEKGWNQMDRREKILAMVENAAMDVMSYHRKEDDEFPVGSIEQAVKDGIVTYEEMAAEFLKEISAE